MFGKKTQESVESQEFNKSPEALRTDVSHSTAQQTVGKPQGSQDINGGPSVGIGEDSKFLMESSLAQGSLSMPQDSRFTAGAVATEIS